MSNNRDISILYKILKHCDSINKAREYFGDSRTEFKHNEFYRAATIEFISQIGELTVALSDDFRSKYEEISWRDIKNMRNIVVHHYDKLDTEIIWEAITEDVPELENFCKRTIAEYESK